MYDKETLKTKKRYDRFAGFYDGMEVLVEKRLFKRLRKSTISKLAGNILEIGVGTGKNLPYYNSKAKVTGIDLSPKMLERAREKSRKLNLKIKLLEMDAQKLKFKDNTFDYVVGSFVLCSIPGPVKALKEIKRVVKPKGKIIFIEHVLSKHKLIALLEHLHNPITSRLFGFNMNRDTRKNILSSGIHIETDEQLAFFDVFRRFICKPESMHDKGVKDNG
ncbi:class I SAM-dependent methyltransferase [Candidatus Woesearchaeota archaeon]|nr:class I SAM-dependent methyltransferase [Candidatus Woesearchaeota archaeon]